MKQTAAKKVVSLFMALFFALGGLWLAPQSALGANYTLYLTTNPSIGGRVQINSGTAGGLAIDTIAELTSVTITAYPESGYVFSGWTVNMPATGFTLPNPSSNTVTFTMPGEPTEIIANFTVSSGPAPSVPGSESSATYALTITKSENGKAGIKGHEQVARTITAISEGKEVLINAIPNDGYRFSHWSSSSHNDTKLAALLKEGVNSVENSFKMPKAPITLTANFVKAEGIMVTAKDAPEIYSGFRNQKAATVSVTEQVAGAWAMEKDNIFTLTDEDGTPLTEVKISSVTFANGADVSADINEKTCVYGAESGGLYSIGNAEIVIKDNVLTLKNFSQTATGGKKNKASFDMTLNLSAEAGFEGDVYVLPKLTGVSMVYEPMLIATAVSPIEISTKTATTQIGYGSVDVADITITEKALGVLEKDTGLYLTIVSAIGPSDIAFNQITLAKNVAIDDASGLKLALKTGSSSAISLTVTTASKKAPAVIMLKGFAVNINRSVPYGDYSLIVGGKAVAENYVPIGELYDGFDTEGIAVDKYIIVATPGANLVMTNNVKITEGSNIALVNGADCVLDAVPIIQNGSFLVPVRFISDALGIEEKDVVWDPVAKTVTILAGGRTVVFTEDSPVMTIDGVPQNMVDANGNSVIAQIIDSRMYVPFRKLADAFGIPVDWNRETNTAEYNPVK